MTAPLTPLLASQPVEALLVRLLAQIGLMLLDQDAQDCWVLLEHGLSFQDGSAALVRPGLVLRGDSGPPQLTVSSPVRAASPELAQAIEQGPTAHAGAPRVGLGSSVGLIIGHLLRARRSLTGERHDARWAVADTNEFRAAAADKIRRWARRCG